MRNLSRVVLAAALGMSALPTLASAQSVEIGPGGVRVRPPVVEDDRPVVRRRIIEESGPAGVTVRRRVIERRATDDDEVFERRVRRTRTCEIRRERIFDPDENAFVIRRTRICGLNP